MFSEARDTDFLQFLRADETPGVNRTVGRNKKRPDGYEEAKDIVKTKMLRALLRTHPHLEPYVDVVVVGTPLTILDYQLRTATLGLRHTPQRMTDMELRPDCNLPGLYFTGQDVACAGWAGALSGAMVTAQKLLGYTVFDFLRQKTLLADLGCGELQEKVRRQIEEGTATTPFEVAAEVFGNAVRHVKRKLGFDV